MGLPLDASGATTPGAISLAYVAAYIPKGQEQYVAYTTAAATGPVLGTITRPDFEMGGTPATSVGPGQYHYTFTAKAPAGFDPTVTNTVAVDGIRNLTAFDLGTNYAGATFNFVPNGAPVTVTRDVIRTASCNACHYNLAFHGGNANGISMCVLCHQPQNADPTTGNSLDAKVFSHKLHMGSQLPSVLGYTSNGQTVPPAPYEIIGYMNSVNNFSTVIDPADPRRCEVCHSQTTGAAQAKAFMTEPTRAACGACHDDVNFATGANHPGGFQLNDTRVCQLPHPPRRDALRCLHSGSARGAHRYGRYLPAEPGYVAGRHKPGHHQRDQYACRTSAGGQLHRAGQQVPITSRCRSSEPCNSPWRDPPLITATPASEAAPPPPPAT